MAETTIQWADVTWNPFRGCRKVSPGCENCYAIYTADMLVKRFGNSDGPSKETAEKYSGLTKVMNNGELNWTGEVKIDYEDMLMPFRMKKGKRIFVNSMSDVFYEKISVEDIAKLFHVMRMNKQHTFMILTKRAKRMREVLTSKEFIDEMRYAYHSSEGTTMWDMPEFPLENVWLGVSVEDQAAADERIPELLATPAGLRFLSCEPLIGAVELVKIENNNRTYNCLTGRYLEVNPLESEFPKVFKVNKIDWVIVGGESGKGARRMYMDDAMRIINDCKINGVSVFMKQVGTVCARICEYKDKKGGDISEWPEFFKVRQFPKNN